MFSSHIPVAILREDGVSETNFWAVLAVGTQLLLAVVVQFAVLS